jgi:luciferase family oxidoreductase group 1
MAAHSSPQIMISVVAGMTERIRVGAAGILLNYASPLKVAEEFLLLEALYRGRIDLGTARGRAAHQVAEDALLDGRLPPDVPGYERKFESMVRFMRREVLVEIPPMVPVMPEVWLLGMSLNSAPVAARLGVCFSVSLIHGASKAEPSILRAYREGFKPSAELKEPRCNLAVGGFCAETAAEAMRLKERWTETTFIVPRVVGDPRQCREQLLELKDRFGVDEIIYTELATDLQARIRSHRLLAEVMGLASSA